SCRGATHLVASFVTWREASVAKSRALLVPLPCPPTGEASPAAGCIGAGLTGAERRARARDSAKRLHADSEETVLTPGDGLSIYALAPDDVLAVDSLRRLRASDFALRAQVDWLKSQYVFEHKPGEELPALVLISRERAPRPRVFDRSLANEYCVPDPGATPGFAYCYPEHFIVDWQGEWKPLHRTP
ncbi:MAG TPA: hypothetical protein VFQ35_01325, partial [Polyangiaceae bacterium]|nr:hypothetical protein [Polyangiaceae bacterium]